MKQNKIQGQRPTMVKVNDMRPGGDCFEASQEAVTEALELAGIQKPVGQFSQIIIRTGRIQFTSKPKKNDFTVKRSPKFEIGPDFEIASM